MAEDKFIKTYNSLCSGEKIAEVLSTAFVEFIDEMYPPSIIINPLRKTFITGYVIRVTESFIKEQEIKSPPQEIKEIIKSNRKIKDKITAIANTLDKHNNIGLSEKLISDFCFIPFSKIQHYSELLIEDYMRNVLSKRTLAKDEQEKFAELNYRFTSYGYLFKLAEDLIKKYGKENGIGECRKENNLIKLINNRKVLINLNKLVLIKLNAIKKIIKNIHK